MFERYRVGGHWQRKGNAWRLLANTAACCVHLVTLLVLAGGVVVLVSPLWLGLRIGLALLLFGMAWQVRPRFGKLPDHVVRLDRSDAPALFALVDDVARRLGAAAPAMISVDAQFNAGYGAVGWRRTRVLRLGYPLWNLLTDDERLAIVGHEIAHDVNGDLRHGAVVRTAMSSLREWYLILRPSTLFTRRRRAYVRRGSGSLVMLAEYLALLMLAPISAAVLSLSGLLAYIGSRSGQHAEYWADDAAARVAGTDASVRALEKTMLAESCAFALRQAVMARALDLWAAQRAYLADLPASELERLRRRARVRRQRIDASHPPSHLRAQLLAQSPRRAGEIQPDDKSWARIATELAPAANITAAALRDALPAPEPAARRASR